MNYIKFLHVTFFFPGYVFLAACFFFPTEWGKSRNVAMSGRQWRYRKWFAPIHSLWIYFVLWNVRADILAYMVEADLISYDFALTLM